MDSNWLMMALQSPEGMNFLNMWRQKQGVGSGVSAISGTGGMNQGTYPGTGGTGGLNPGTYQTNLSPTGGLNPGTYQPNILGTGGLNPGAYPGTSGGTGGLNPGTYRANMPPQFSMSGDRGFGGSNDLSGMSPRSYWNEGN